MTRERLIDYIYKQMDKRYYSKKMFGRKITDQMFTQICFEKWACDEIKKLLLIASKDSPLYLLETFREKMGYFATLPGHEDGSSFHFSVAEDVACDLLDQVIFYFENKRR